jgi:exosortase
LTFNKNTWVPASLVLLFLIVYLEHLVVLIKTWSSNPDYGHGFLVIPIALYLAWSRRDSLRGGPVGKAASGVVLTALWAVLYAIGMVGRIDTLANLSMILFPIAAAAVTAGPQGARAMIVPAVFLVFMFPVPSEIYTKVTNPLLHISTSASFHILSGLGLPVLKEGNIISLAGYTMEVVHACSGIRSLITIMALAYLMAVLMMKGAVQGLALFLVSIPTAVIGNVMRITITALLANFISPAAAEGFSHTMAGIATFFVSLLILYCCMELIRWMSRRETPLPSA